MPSPLFLAAASFFTVIVVGCLLVALNDWLERRHADPQLSIGISPRRATVPLFARHRRKSFRPAIRFGRQNGRRNRPDLVVDWF